MIDDDAILLGYTTRGLELRANVMLDLTDRRRHIFCLGATGTGKSTFLKSQMLADLEAGRPFAFIDPLGLNASELIDCVPRHRVNDIRYLDLSDTDFPRGLNPLDRVPKREQSLVATQILSAFYKLFDASMAEWPRLSVILQNGLLLLLNDGNSTLIGLLRLLADDHYRAQLIAKCSDVMVRSFWETEFASYDRSFVVNAIAPVQGKLRLVLTSEALRLLLGQRRSTIDVRSVMREGKVLIVSLAKGKVGPTSAALAGAFLINQFTQAAEERASLPERERERLQHFMVYADEFQDYASMAFAEGLAQSRNGATAFCLANQYLDQLPEGVLPSVLANCGNLIVFRTSARDAVKLAPEFGFDSTQAFTDLANFTARARLLLRGAPAEPVRLETIPPTWTNQGTRRSVIARSRNRYARPRSQVERMIAGELGV